MDIVADCFPVAQKFQSLSYGPAVALAGSEKPWQNSLTMRRTYLLRLAEADQVAQRH